MSFEIVPLQPFVKQLKRLAKKFPSLREEMGELVDQLSIDPELGTPLGRSCFKIRLAIASKAAGKSGGARVITHVRVIGHRVYLLAIYDKSEKDSLTDKEIKELLALIDPA